MEEADGKSKLYDLLTQELRDAENQIYQIVNVGSGAVAAILAAGFNQSNHVLRLFMFLTSYLIIIPMIRLIKGNRARIWRITTYMRTHLEPGLPGIKWQTDLALSRTQNWKSSFITPSQILVVQLATVVAGTAALINLCLVANWTIKSLIPFSLRFNIAAAAAIAAFVTGNVLLLIYERRTEQQTRRGGAIEQDYLQSWEALQKKLSGSESDLIHK
jgi:membrane associated rhomboid family serine protease